MRLFNVQTRKFKQFDPDVPRYAIASHRWAPATETSYQDVQGRRHKRRAGYKKLNGFVKYMKKSWPAVEWLWMDTCCIDQRNNAELSEAINSMFKWYRNAVVCLAYLVDVSNGEDEDEFRRSEWFSRGWTLQELIAPRTVIFLTRDWQAMGYKGIEISDRSLVPRSVGPCRTPLIASMTGIPDAVLNDSRRLEAVSKEERLTWVHGRRTTREEDMSYCLVGLVDAAIGANYGEGAQRARTRLLREIRFRDADPARPKPSGNVPFGREPHYVDRSRLATQIDAKLAPGTRVALVGLGGVGKSQLAIEHCYRLRERREDAWVLWLHASNAARFEQSVRDVADLVKLNGRADPKADILQLLRNWLRDENHGSWLVVLDNADDASFLLEPGITAGEARRRIDQIPSCQHGSVLITTRSRSEALKLVYEENVVEVMPMGKEEAEVLLVRKLGRESADDAALARALDYMPLAITQAAAYIRERGSRCSVQQYREEIEQSRKSRTSLLRRDVPVHSRDAEASNAVMLTWQISLEHVYRTRKSAADLLSLMSLCDRVAIPELLIRADGEDADSAASSSAFEEDLVTLRSFSLVTETADRQEWEMHRLVQDATQVWLEEMGRFDEVFSRFIHRLSQLFPAGNFENWSLCHKLFPHAISAAEHRPARESEDAQLQWASVMYNAAWYASEQGDYDSSLVMATSSMIVESEQLGDEDERTLWSKAMVAKTYWHKGRWQEAEQLEVELMETRRTKLGADHPDTLTSMANLAATYRDRGLWEEAEQLEVKVMETRRTKLGADHPDTLAVMANLARTYQDQGRWEEAEQLFVKVMETRRTKLGADHPDMLTVMGNLALTYRDRGRWEEAEQLEVKVMETRRTMLGADHPDTLTSMANLAMTYRDRGRWEEAEQLEVKVIETRRTKLGADHPDTLTIMANLAGTFKNQGRWEEAEQLFVKVMETRRTKLGAGHPDTLTVMANLAGTFRNQGRWEEAEQLEVKVIETMRTKLGADHPSTLTSMANLAVTYRDQGRWEEAEQLFVKAMETRRTKLGADHPDTLTSMANLAATYFYQDRWVEAEEMQARAADGHQKVYGVQHPDTLTVTSCLAHFRRMRQQTPLEDVARDETSHREVQPTPQQRSYEVRRPFHDSQSIDISEQSRRQYSWKWLNKLHLKARK